MISVRSCRLRGLSGERDSAEVNAMRKATEANIVVRRSIAGNKKKYTAYECVFAVLHSHVPTLRFVNQDTLG